MSDPARPSAGARSELRRTIRSSDTDIPVLSADPFNLDGRLLIGDEEYIRCTGRSGYTLTGCERGVSREDGGSEAKTWRGGTSVDQVSWTAVEIVTAVPTPTLAMVGREFIYRDAAGDSYAFNIGASQGGTPYIDWVNEPPPSAEEAALQFTWTEQVTGLTGPRGVALDGSGNVYVTYAAGGVGTVQSFTSALASRWTISPGGDVRHVTIVGSTVYYINGTSQTVVRKTTAAGASGGGDLGVGGGVTNLLGITNDATNLYADSQASDVAYKLSTTGTALATVGATAGMLNPTALYFRTNLYVLDAGNGRVLVFDGTTLTLTTTITLGVGVADGQVSTSAEGLLVDTQGRMWIADTGNHRINVYDTTGAFLASHGAFGTGSEQYKYPRQIALGSGDTIWVADYANSRLVTLTLKPTNTAQLGFEEYDWDEEFIGGGTTTGAIGERGWSFNGNGSVSVQSSTAAHPGIVRVSSGTAATGSGRLSLGPWLLPQVEKMDFIFAPASNGTATSLIQRIGLTPQATSGGTAIVDGILVEFNDATSAGFLLVVSYIGSTASTTTTGIAVVAGEFYLARFERTAAGEVTVTVFRLSTGQQESVIKTGISQTAQFDAVFASRTGNSTAKTLDAEYWSGSFSGLTRT